MKRTTSSIPTRSLSAALLAVLSTGVAGCSYIPAIPYLNENPTTQPAEVAAANVPPSRPSEAVATTSVPVHGIDATLASSDVEILWEVPEDTVDGFVVRYGTSRNQMTNEVKLTAAQLELRTDAERGNIYRHVLRDIPADREIFVDIAAFRGAEVSPPSRVFEVPAADSPLTGTSPMAQPSSVTQ